jgi:hypothetical protein
MPAEVPQSSRYYLDKTQLYHLYHLEQDPRQERGTGRGQVSKYQFLALGLIQPAK